MRVITSCCALAAVLTACGAQQAERPPGGAADPSVTTSVEVDRTGFVVPTTPAPAVRAPTIVPPTTTSSTVPSSTVPPAGVTPGCSTPPESPYMPSTAFVRCASGWWMAAWIGESGDGIIDLERWADGRWEAVTYGPHCGGVAAIPVAELVALGMPEDLAATWGSDAQMCTDPAAFAATRRAA